MLSAYATNLFVVNLCAKLTLAQDLGTRTIMHMRGYIVYGPAIHA